MFDVISVETFWKILLFVFLVGVGLLAAVTLQRRPVAGPNRQWAAFRPVPVAFFR